MLSSGAHRCFFVRISCERARNCVQYPCTISCVSERGFHGTEFLHPQRPLPRLLVSGLGGRDGGGYHQGAAVRQPRRGVRPVLLYLRLHGGAAGRGVLRTAQPAGCAVLRLRHRRHRGGMADGKTAGTRPPPQVVGLLGQALQHRRLHLPAVLTAVGRAGRGHGVVDERLAL